MTPINTLAMSLGNLPFLSKAKTRSVFHSVTPAPAAADVSRDSDAQPHCALAPGRFERNASAHADDSQNAISFQFSKRSAMAAGRGDRHSPSGFTQLCACGLVTERRAGATEEAHSLKNQTRARWTLGRPATTTSHSPFTVDGLREKMREIFYREEVTRNCAPWRLPQTMIPEDFV